MEGIIVSVEGTRTTAMRLLKRTVYSLAEMTFHQSMDDIASKMAISDHHPDSRKGVAAFW